MYMKISLRQKKSAMGLRLFVTGVLILHMAFHSGLSGFVLCVGSDGHIAVERSIDDSTCSDAEKQLHQQEIDGHHGACCDPDLKHCGECRDISLTSDCQDEQARNPDRPVDIRPIHSLVIPASLSDSYGIEYRHQISSANNHSSYHLSLASIRSTVLLI